MNNSSLLEFGGSGQLIATAICDFNAGNKTYFKDDIVFYFENANINFSYGHITSHPKNDRSQIYYDQFFLDSFVADILPIDYNFDILNESGYKERFVYEVESCLAVDKTIILKDKGISNTIRVEGVNDFEIKNVNDIIVISSDSFVDGCYYNVNYRKNILSNSLVLDNKDLDIPYLRVQIKFEGNKDKETSTNYICIPKTSLHLTPVFNLQDNSVSHIRLMFKVLEGDEKPEILVV